MLKLSIEKIKNLFMDCCKVKDPCDTFVLPGLPAIIVVTFIGFFSKMLLKFLPSVKDELPSWGKFLLNFIVQIFVGFLIQSLGNRRNMWKNPFHGGWFGIINILIVSGLMLFAGLFPAFFSDF